MSTPTIFSACFKVIDTLSPADRHLATTLTLGVLRWQIRLDEQLKLLIAKPKSKLDPEVSGRASHGRISAPVSRSHSGPRRHR